jgi:hypothetical protein
MKKLIFILSFFLLNSAIAQNTKLLCDITLREDDNGKITSQKIKTRVEVSVFKDGNIFIIPDNSLYPVTTEKSELTLEIINYSTLSTWKIQNTNIEKITGAHYATTITIDRNAGTISYYHLFMLKDNKSLTISTTTGFGNCEKIDTNKKKF